MGHGLSKGNKESPTGTLDALGKDRQKFPKTEATPVGKDKDELFEPLKKIGPICMKQMQVKDKVYIVSIVTKRNVVVEFACCEVSTVTVYSREWTSIEINALPALKGLNLDTVFQSISRQVQQGTVKIVNDKDLSLSFALDSPHQKHWRMTLDKRREFIALSRLFLEPLASFHRHPLEGFYKDKEMIRNKCKVKFGEVMSDAKVLEVELDPLKKESLHLKTTRNDLQQRIDLLQKRINHASSNEYQFDYLYPKTCAKFPLHTPSAQPFEPSEIDQYNKTCLQAIKVYFSKMNKQPSSVLTTMEQTMSKLLERDTDPTMHSDVMKLISNIDAWEFDCFAVDRRTNDMALFYVSYSLIVKNNLINILKLNEETLITFLLAIQAGYHNNPYHNSLHASDVLQVLHFVLTVGGLQHLLRLTPADIFSALLAAVIHDYDHPGLNNNFHIRTSSYLSTLYNDRSVLENHHCASIFDLVRNPRFNIFANFTDEVRREIRDTIIEMVLSTDMGLHAKIFQTFKAKLQENASWSKKEEQRLALSIALKMADISNCARPQALYSGWAERIAQEFYAQGDAEAKLKLSVSPFMDRRRHEIDFNKGQVSFMNYIVVPLFEAGVELLPNLDFTIQHIQQNKENYTSQLA